MAKLLDARIRHLTSGLLKRKPLLLFKILSKYAQKYIWGKSSLRGVVFASSYKCNFNCTHCYANRFRDTETPPLSLNEKLVVMKECLQLGAISFDFVGGEIGLSPQLEKLLAASHPNKTHFSLASNGYDLTREKVRYLKKVGIDKISISIDSGSEEEHDRFRRKEGSYKRCFEALDNIHAEGLTPVIITCVSRGMTKEKAFHDLVDYAIKNRIELVFSAAIPFGQWEGNMDVLCNEEDISYMRELHDKYPFLTRDCYENMGNWGCPAAKQIIYISEYGDVMPCAFTHISFGNIRYEPLRDIRQRMLTIPQFENYHPVCLAGEDSSFIEKYLSKTFGVNPYPPTAEEVFPEDTNTNTKYSFSKNIKKVDRSCPLCGSNRNEVVASGREHEFDNTTRDLFFVVRCLDCNLVYLNPRPDDSTLDIIYPKQYYCYKNTFSSSFAKQSPLVSLKNKLNNSFGFPRRIRRLLTSLPRSEDMLRVLDVGCGSGSALDYFRDFTPGSIETTGLDFNKRALELVAAKQHKIISGRIEDISLPENYFDIIYSNNVIEHVAEPFVMIKKISNALKPGGVFLCETPNFDSLDARIFSRSGHWGGFHFPRHWTFFTAKTLEKMAKRANLKMESVTYQPVPIFWIWTLHSYIYHAKANKKLADKFFPLIEDKSNFLTSLLLKIIFSITDMGLKTFMGKTSLMTVVLRKQEQRVDE
ncbi:MAG: methyltransferase domain-containing protein [Candidatus Ratteibacteria bacterium]|nr:methyltransferase domain-containing protein [Candidatus Ratteibacteria bacterium]